MSLVKDRSGTSATETEKEQPVRQEEAKEVCCPEAKGKIPSSRKKIPRLSNATDWSPPLVNALATGDLTRNGVLGRWAKPAGVVLGANVRREVGATEYGPLFQELLKRGARKQGSCWQGKRGSKDISFNGQANSMLLISLAAICGAQHCDARCFARNTPSHPPSGFAVWISPPLSFIQRNR